MPLVAVKIRSRSFESRARRHRQINTFHPPPSFPKFSAAPPPGSRWKKPTPDPLCSRDARLSGGNRGNFDNCDPNLSLSLIRLPSSSSSSSDFFVLLGDPRATRFRPRNFLVSWLRSPSRSLLLFFLLVFPLSLFLFYVFARIQKSISRMQRLVMGI
jgi:hypothetical protein